VNKKFEIISIPENAPENTEYMGTKEKFWFRDSQLGLCLYKKARQNTGEDWAEKITAELCKLLNIPHAEYELAIYQNQKGIISKSFLPNNARLVLGNEILASQFMDYPQEISNPSHHTLDNIFTTFQNLCVNLPLNWQPVEGIQTAIDTFIGYLLLDAWIGNSDRHHENWAFINVQGKDYLAPTYDHGSSLGRNESDEKRKARLQTKDKDYSVEAYANKCLSCLYDKVGAKKPLKTFDAFFYAAAQYPQSTKIWLNNLAKISLDNILNLWQCFPENYLSPIAVEFAQKILEINGNKLLDIRKEL
jgi:hypothetical protein